MKSQFCQSNVGCAKVELSSGVNYFVCWKFDDTELETGKFPPQNTNARATKWDWCSVRVNKIQSIIICFRLIFDWITSHKSPSPPIFHSLYLSLIAREGSRQKQRTVVCYTCMCASRARVQTRDTHTGTDTRKWGLLWPPVQIHSQRVAIVTAVGLCDQIEIDEMLHEQGHRGIYAARVHTHTRTHVQTSQTHSQSSAG